MIKLKHIKIHLFTTIPSYVSQYFHFFIQIVSALKWDTIYDNLVFGKEPRQG